MRALRTVCATDDLPRQILAAFGRIKESHGFYPNLAFMPLSAAKLGFKPGTWKCIGHGNWVWTGRDQLINSITKV